MVGSQNHEKTQPRRSFMPLSGGLPTWVGVAFLSLVADMLDPDLGWIKLYRRLLESDLMTREKNHKLLVVFLWCLMKANRFERNGLQPGQFACGRLRGSSELDLSPSSFNRALKNLEKRGEISLKSNSQYTTVTICNWRTYQNQDSEVGQQADSKRTASGQQADSKRTHNKKEERRKKKEEVNLMVGFDEWWKIYPKKAGKEAARKAYPKAIERMNMLFWPERGETFSDEFPTPVEYLFDRITAYAAAPCCQIKKPDGKPDLEFIPNPATWLNAGKYDDDPATWEIVRSATVQKSNPYQLFDDK